MPHEPGTAAMPHTTPVIDMHHHRTYPDELEIVPLTGLPDVAVHVPGSKSITNRALVLAALGSWGPGCTLHGALQSEDTEVMVDCLRQLGYRMQVYWPTL